MTKTQAFARGPAIGNSRFYMGSLMSFLLRGAETDGRFSITEGAGRIGNEPPPHVHAWENEIYYILEGSAEFFIEGQANSVAAGAGEVVFLPQGKAHGIYFRSDVFRTLLMAQATGEHPAEMDGYFHAVSQTASSLSLPDGATTYASGEIESAVAAALAKGIRFLTPEETKRKLPNYPGFGANLVRGDVSA